MSPQLISLAKQLRTNPTKLEATIAKLARETNSTAFAVIQACKINPKLAERVKCESR